MSNLLKDLNEQQIKAVTFLDGPLLILAGAGSGKTRALTHRAAYLITEKKVSPENILLLTFTNKAAGEMKSRIQQLLTSYPYAASNAASRPLPLAGTFHSFCARILRIEGKYLGDSPDFLIYDEDDQQEVIKQVLKKQDLSPKNYNPNSLLTLISQAKNELISSLEYPKYAKTNWQKTAAEVYLDYQRQLKRSSALDFDDLLMETVNLFKKNPAILEKYQNKYQYILVDEYQDTNHAQYVLTKMLTKKYRNLTVVGDASQCLPPETLITTPTGLEKIENLSNKNMVIAATGRGETNNFLIEKVHKRLYKGKLIHISTTGGKQLQLTPNHLIFSSLQPSLKIFWVYLMYRKDKGYRIGTAKGSRCGDKRRNIIASIGLKTRGNQESADKMWVIKTCFSKEDAIYWKMYYSFEYGIPSTVFETCGRKMLISQEYINKLFSSIDTNNRVKKLMEDLYINPDYPHHRPKGTSGYKQPDRQIVHLKFFEDPRKSGKNPWSAHRIALNTTDRALEKQVKYEHFYTRPGRKNTWRTEIMRLDYSEAYNTAQQLSKAAGNIDISHEVFILKKNKLFFHPASHIHPEMILAIEKDGKIESDVVKEVKWIDYEGPVYDIDINHVHNYLANGVVVHNSIYSWRGANFQNLINLKNDFRELTIINLEQNYRSTKNILNAANCVIKQNTTHPILKLWTDNPVGEKINLYQAYDEIQEAEFIVQKILQFSQKSYADFSILYRTNAQSRVLEETFLKLGIPYLLYGGTRFYQRKEIKDILSYLRLAVNPKDEVSLSRIEKIGKGRMLKFFNWKENANHKEKTTMQILKEIMDATQYLEIYDSAMEEDLSRLENIKELQSVATQYTNLNDFLENVALVEQEYLREQTKIGNPQNAVRLMTLHSAKGLEFPVVFIVGMEEGIFPHSRSLLDVSEIEEERRLCYVGFTRAKEKVFLTYTQRRLFFGQRMNNMISRFVEDIPENLLEVLNKEF